MLHGTVGSIMRRSIDRSVGRSVDPARIERVCTLVEPQTNVMERERATILHFSSSPLSFPLQKGIQLYTDHAFDEGSSNQKNEKNLKKFESFYSSTETEIFDGKFVVDRDSLL